MRILNVRISHWQFFTVECVVCIQVLLAFAFTTSLLISFSTFSLSRSSRDVEILLKFQFWIGSHKNLELLMHTTSMPIDRYTIFSLLWWLCNNLDMIVSMDMSMIASCYEDWLQGSVTDNLSNMFFSMKLEADHIFD